MIVFGGYDSSDTTLNDGGIWIQSTDTWETLMLDIAFFGGRNYTGFLNDFEIFHVEDPYP